MTALFGRHVSDCGHLGCWPCARDFRFAATGSAVRRSVPSPVEPLLPAAPGDGNPEPNT